jgi:hypothetical protein
MITVKVIYNSKNKIDYLSNGWDYYNVYDNYLILSKVEEQIITEEIILLKNVKSVIIENQKGNNEKA